MRDGARELVDKEGASEGVRRNRDICGTGLLTMKWAHEGLHSN